MPTLLPDRVMGELPSVELPVNTGTFPAVPEPVTVCAVAPTANAAMQRVTSIILMRINSSLFSLIVVLFIIFSWILRCIGVAHRQPNAAHIIRYIRYVECFGR
jgi:hypothetical protein